MGYVVYATVPIPVLILIVLLIRVSLLDGADKGIEQYLTGDPDDDKKWDRLRNGTIWAEGIGQIFFSLSVCVGVMTSYGSGNRKDSPIVSNSIIISLINSGISFLSGFVVWAVIGYLKH